MVVNVMLLTAMMPSYMDALFGVDQYGNLSALRDGKNREGIG